MDPSPSLCTKAGFFLAELFGVSFLGQPRKIFVTILYDILLQAL